MPTHTIPQLGEDWLGLTTLAALLGESQALALTHEETVSRGEIVDRLYRSLEILSLVEENAGVLLEQASGATESEAMKLAVELRRLANRLQAVGEFLSDASDGVLALEDRLLVELDSRFRTHGVRHHAA